MTVRQETKKGPVTVENDFESPQGPVHLLIRAPLNDWKKLLSFNDTVKLRIFRWALFEVEDRVENSSRNLSRGLSKGESDFVEKMKRIAFVTSFLIKNYSETDFYEKLVKAYGGPQPGGSCGKWKNPKPHELTAFVLDQIFAKEKKKFSIRRNWVDDPANFRRTYLDVSRIKKKTTSYFMFWINTCGLSDEFKPYITKSENPIEVFKLFYKEKSYLLNRFI
jgi:hypothetical protein